MYSYEVLSFRNYMCENGIELTPEEAKILLEEIIILIEEIKRELYLNRDVIEYFINATEADKAQIRSDLASIGIEMTPCELDGLIDLIIKIYAEDRFY